MCLDRDAALDYPQTNLAGGATGEAPLPMHRGGTETRTVPLEAKWVTGRAGFTSFSARAGMLL
jgi:hypothetical protein